MEGIKDQENGNFSHLNEKNQIQKVILGGIRLLPPIWLGVNHTQKGTMSGLW